MRGADLPAPVRRWVRRPSWFGFAALLLAAGLVYADIAAARDDERTFADAHRVTAEIASGWDGGRGIDVSYRHPESGERIHATTYVWQVELPDRGSTSVAIEVARNDPTAVKLEGDRFPAAANLGNYVPWVLLPFVIWGSRRFTMHRSLQLAASPGVAFAMQARTEPPAGLRRRWRLHLHPLDVDPDEPGVQAVCTVPLVAAPSLHGPFPVEVKGSPRPFGRVLARSGAGGREVVLWPSGRALRSGTQRPWLGQNVRAASAAAVAGLGALLAVCGFAWFILDSEAIDVEDRAETTEAVVTGRTETDARLDLEVTYAWEARQLEGTLIDAPPAEEGESLTIRIDPQAPDRIWSTTQAHPPGMSSGDLPFTIFLIGAAIAVAGAIATAQAAGRRSSHPSGQEPWESSSIPLKAHRLRFRTPRIEIGDRDLHLLIPGFFGGRRWTIPIAEISATDLTTPRLDDGTELLLRSPVHLPYLFTTGPYTTPTTLLLFRTPQRTPALRHVFLAGPINTDFPFSWRASRSTVGAELDGVFLRAADPAAASDRLHEAGVARVASPAQWLQQHRELVTDPVEKEHLRSRHAKAARLARASAALLYGSLFVAVFLLNRTDVPAGAWALPAFATALGLVLKWASRRSDPHSPTLRRRPPPSMP